MSLIAIALAAALVEPTTAQRFDLVCRGTSTTMSRLLPTSETATNTRYRLDLAGKRWCADDCQRVFDLTSSTPAEIVLTREEGPGVFNELKVNRTTGRMTGRTTVGGSDSFTNATCTRAAFSGMPTAAF